MEWCLVKLGPTPAALGTDQWAPSLWLDPDHLMFVFTLVETGVKDGAPIATVPVR